MRVCLLVAVGRGGCWLVVVVVVVVVVGGVTPRILQVDILAKVLSSQELPKKSSFLKKMWGNAARLFAENFDARLAGIVI